MRKGAKQTRHSTRLFFMVARAARTAVVFRRGPAKQVQMLRWDLASDAVTAGQWLSGRLYNERCDVSPDGRLVVYFAGKFKPGMDTFTAVCRPPYFTALALWPDSGTWGGGGFFVRDRLLILNYGHIGELNDGAGIPADFEIGSVTEYRAHHPEDERLAESRGWRLVARGVDGERTREMWAFAEPWVHERPSPLQAGLVLERRWLGMFEMNGPSHVYSYRLIDRSRRTRAGEPICEELGRLDWADWDHDGSLLLANNGCLLRRPMSGSLAGTQAPATVVADLRDNVFKNVPPPDAARVWP